MNFALPAVLVILSLIPGILCHKGYFSGRFPREISSDSPVVEFATYFLFALPIDAFALWLLSDAQRKESFELILDLSTSSLERTELQRAVEIFSRSWLPGALFYFTVCVTAFIIGVIVRRFVWAFRLDLRIPSLRMKSDYYYILQGRVRGFPRTLLPYADVLSAHPSEGSRLYRGLVEQLSFTADGEIKELVLTNAFRGKGRGPEFQWKEIPSNQFMLLGRNLHSVNMRYFEIAAEVSGRLSRTSRWLRGVLRSFLFEEP